MYYEKAGSHQPVAVEGGVHAPEKHPARPQVFQSKLQCKIRQQHQRPHHHTFQEGVSAAKIQKENLCVLIKSDSSLNGEVINHIFSVTFSKGLTGANLSCLET